MGREIGQHSKKRNIGRLILIGLFVLMVCALFAIGIFRVWG
jgi:hypothetical protein